MFRCFVRLRGTLPRASTSAVYDHCGRAGLDVDDDHHNTYTINDSHRWIRVGFKRLLDRDGE